MKELALASFAAANDAHLVGEPRSARFAAFKAGFDARAELERLHALGFRFLGRSDRGFPPLLRAIHDPPPGLFLRGKAEATLLALPAVAIVGARACSAYGRQIARSVARELASAGLVIVSGLARGIDAEAHRGALEAEGSRSPYWAVASIATTRLPTASSHDRSRRAAWSSRSTHLASSRHRGASPPAIESSPVSAPPPWSSRPVSAAAR